MYPGATVAKNLNNAGTPDSALLRSVQAYLLISAEGPWATSSQVRVGLSSECHDTQQLTRNGLSPDVLQASFPSCAQGQLLGLSSRGRTAVSGPRASLSPESEISFPSAQRCRGGNPGDSGGGACAQGCLALSPVRLPSGKLSIPQHCSQVAIYGVKVNRDQHVYSLRCEPGEGGGLPGQSLGIFRLQGTWSSEEAGLPQRSLVSLQVPTNANAHGWLTPLPTNLEAVCVKEGLQTSAPPAVGPQATCSMALSFISFLGKRQMMIAPTSEAPQPCYTVHPDSFIFQ